MSPYSRFQAEAVFLAPDDVYPFCITAKRYTSPVFDARDGNEEALTLVFLHSTGFCKEIWEPTLEELVECASSQPRTVIREVWSIECPNHGESAVLNENTLQQPEHRHSFTCEKYALAAHRFLLAGPLKGAKVDFKRRNLVGIGHSLGGVAVTILQHIEPSLPFQSIIIIEPMLSPGGRQFLKPLGVDLVRGAYERRDVWPNRERALQALKERGRTKMWDPRTLDVYVRYALRTHPGAKFVDTPYNGVTLCCTRDEEAAMYRDVDGPTKPVPYLDEACSRFPVHVVFGAIIDYIPQEVHDAIVDPLSRRHFASVSRVENAGHLVPQQAPVSLAKLISKILVRGTDSNSKKDELSSARAKL